MRYVLGMVSLILVISLSGLATAEEITLATLEWEPYVGEQLDQFGFTADIVRTVFQHAGYTVNIEFMPWARVLKLVERGKYAAAFPGYYSEERAQIYALSAAFANGPLGFYALKESDISYTTLEELKPYKIGVVRGYVNTPEFDAAEFLQKDEADSDANNLEKLLRKRVDLIVIDKLTAQHLLNTTFADAADQVEFLEPPLENKPLHVMFSRQVEGYEQLLADFNQALNALEADGTIQSIMQRHGFE